jgi:ankyrin repeat protein
MVQLLLDHGASVNALDGSGFSPLMLAAQPQSFSNVGDGSLLELLVAHGANLEKTNAHGQTPREYAAMRHEGPWRKIAAVLERLEQN